MEENTNNNEIVENVEETKPIDNGKKNELKLKVPKKLIVTIGIILCVCVAGIFVYNNFIKKSKTELITVSSIEEILEIDELSTLKYYYNAIATVPDDKGNVSYNIAYRGHVVAGIDFTKIKVDIDETNKTIIINIPKAKVTDWVIETGSLDYIFVDKSASKNKTIDTDSYKIAKEDLIKRTSNDESILEIATKNSKEAIDALMDPWLKLANSDYQYETKVGE